LKKVERSGTFYVYIVQCKDGTYYTGYTSNLDQRVAMHNRGHGAKYSRGRGSVELVYVKEYRYYKNALHAERNLKKLTRAQKEGLIRIYEKIKASS